MADFKKMIPCIYIKNKNLVKGFEDLSIVSNEPVNYVTELAIKGVDEIIVIDLSSEDNEHEDNLLVIRDISQNCDVNMIGCGNVKRLEDVKKLIYAGCKACCLDCSLESNAALLEEASKRFSKSKIYAFSKDSNAFNDYLEQIDKYAKGTISYGDYSLEGFSGRKITFWGSEYQTINSDPDLLAKAFDIGFDAVALDSNCYFMSDYLSLKINLKEKGYDVDLYKSPYAFEDFKTDDKGLVPVVVQDNKTSEVLMVAYMNKEAFDKTIETGIMHYYSRSRSELWLKGLTSGHYQYLKEMSADCDMDTILCKVTQIGAACHTGSYSCFFNNILKKPTDEVNPYKVFEDVFGVIMDRKVNPKEGSYTNYLFDKGIDKILKKVGEEATEIVIAAKNPEKEEVKYEIADFLYHVMVLMAECDLTWDDITEELANR